ncbi:MAG TPA: hypothetical protein VHC22_32615 [Pirellulales bacterium]|nr:hypothetical protein [Pirellulales bacterium]
MLTLIIAYLGYGALCGIVFCWSLKAIPPACELVWTDWIFWALIVLAFAVTWPVAMPLCLRSWMFEAGVQKAARGV